VYIGYIGVINVKKSNNKSKRIKHGSMKQNVASKIAVPWGDLDEAEQISLVFSLILKGLPFTKVAAYIQNTYNADFSRQKTYDYFRKAVKRRWIKYMPPHSSELERDLKDRFAWLDTKVIRTSRFDDVAYYGAEKLVDLLKRYGSQNSGEVHIGFAGGHAMRKLAQIFATLLGRSSEKIPCKLTFHALVAGFDVYEPTTDPNTFFTLFHSGLSPGVEFNFVGLHTPPVVRSDQYATLREMEGIKESYREVSKIDIIVTSATNWSDEHSTFRNYMQKSRNCFDLLESHKCIGDMLWLPLGLREPISVQTAIRAMTLMELNKLPDFIAKGKSVLLVLGPCSKCNQTKAEVLKAILNQKKKLITDLVVDSRSAQDMLI
jgi:DNA-binding transcriptional regulator LsrR (DeoR family)